MKSIANIGETCDLIDKALVAIDTEGIVKYVNKTFSELFLSPDISVLDKYYSDAIKLMDRTGLNKLDLFAPNKMAVRECEGVLLVDGKVEHYIRSKARCHFNDNNEQQFWLFIFEDITEEVELKQQLKHKRRLEVLGELAVGVAHDLNNILGGIIGCTEIITMEHSDNKRLYKFTKSILQSANNAATLSRKLLRFSAPSDPVFELLDIGYLLKDVVEIISHSLDKKIVIETNFIKEETIVFGDRGELEVVFFNLAINAQDAMPHGGVITITTEIIADSHAEIESPFLNSSRYLKLRIKDTGEGIPPSMLDKIFDSNFTTKGLDYGDGLGLNAVSDILKDHSGAITVTSDLGVGSEFIVYLPLVENQSLEPHSVKHYEVENLTIKEVAEQRKVALLVDDNDVIRLAISEILNVLGYDVLQADNGKDGIKLLRENNNIIDFVLLDMIMPVMDGRDTLIAMRSINSEIDIFIQSGYIEQVSGDELIALGASGFLFKPFKTAELKNIIDHKLKKKINKITKKKMPQASKSLLRSAIKANESPEMATKDENADVIALLLVEKNESIREIIQDVLYDSGFAVVAYETIEDAEAALKGGRYFPLYLIDIDLRNSNDKARFSSFKKFEDDLPRYIIVSSEKEAEGAAVRALELGADDFLAKPFSLNFLKVRLEVARKHIQNEQLRIDAEAMLKENEERMALAIQGVEIGMWDWKINEKEFYASDKCKDIFGYVDSNDSSVLEHLIGITFKDDQSKLSLELNRYLCNPVGMLSVEFRITHPDRGDIWILAIAKMFDHKSITKQKRLIGISMDITKRKNVELVLRKESQKLEEMVVLRTNELLQINEELSKEIEARKIAEDQNREHQLKLMDADKLASLGILVSGIGHEINNPIQFIMLNLPFIKSAWEGAIPILDEYYKQNSEFTLRGIPYELARKRLPNMAADIMEGAERIRNIVKELREYSRQRRSEDFVDTDLVEVILAAKSLLMRFMGGRSSDLILDIPGEPVVITINRTRIEQVIINLLQNACLSLNGSDKKEINVKLGYSADKEKIEIKISDSGCGIAPDDLKHLTDPFFTTREEEGGTGLGLAICKRIIHNHSGEMVFDSELGVGTTVTVTLPVKKNKVENSIE